MFCSSAGVDAGDVWVVAVGGRGVSVGVGTTCVVGVGAGVGDVALVDGVSGCGSAVAGVAVAILAVEILACVVAASGAGVSLCWGSAQATRVIKDNMVARYTTWVTYRALLSPDRGLPNYIIRRLCCAQL